MDDKVAQDFEADFEEIFEKWEAGTLPNGTIWCGTLICPPNGRNTKSARALIEMLVNCLLIGKFKCQYAPRIQLGWTGAGYRVGVMMPPLTTRIVSLVESPPECNEQSTSAHDVDV